MTVINTADKLYVGTSLASKAYAGTNQVWPPAAAYDAATTAWINAVVAAGGTVSSSPAGGRRKVVDDLIVGLKADGVWAKLDRLYLFAAENTQSALMDVVGPVTAAAGGSPTFTANTGYTVDGTNTVDLNYNPTVNATNFTQNSCHVGAWNLFNGTNGNQLVTDNPGTSLQLFPKFVDSNAYTRVNDGGTGVAIGDPRGLIVGDRSNSANRDTYQNGSLLGNVSAASVAIHNSVTTLFVGGPCAAVSLGGSLTSANHLALYNRLRTYMTAVGVP